MSFTFSARNVTLAQPMHRHNTPDQQISRFRFIVSFTVVNARILSQNSRSWLGFGFLFGCCTLVVFKGADFEFSVNPSGSQLCSYRKRFAVGFSSE
jgi:hypothetical protein